MWTASSTTLRRTSSRCTGSPGCFPAGEPQHPPSSSCLKTRRSRMSITLTHPTSIIGGLPVIATVHYFIDQWTGEPSAEVVEIYWMRKNGKRNKPITPKVWARALAHDPNFTRLIADVRRQGELTQ